MSSPITWTISFGTSEVTRPSHFPSVPLCAITMHSVKAHCNMMLRLQEENEREMWAKKMETYGDACTDFTPVPLRNEEHRDVTHLGEAYIFQIKSSKWFVK